MFIKIYMCFLDTFKFLYVNMTQRIKFVQLNLQIDDKEKYLYLEKDV